MPRTMVRRNVVRAVRYARSASDNNAIIMRQIASIRRYCMEMNYRLLAEFSDNHTGGQASSPRQALDDMLEEMRLQNYDILVMVRPDRQARDYVIFQRIVNECRSMDVQVL